MIFLLFYRVKTAVIFTLQYVYPLYLSEFNRLMFLSKKIYMIFVLSGCCIASLSTYLYMAKWKHPTETNLLQKSRKFELTKYGSFKHMTKQSLHYSISTGEAPTVKAEMHFWCWEDYKRMLKQSPQNWLVEVGLVNRAAVSWKYSRLFQAALTYFSPEQSGWLWTACSALLVWRQIIRHCLGLFCGTIL